MNIAVNGTVVDTWFIQNVLGFQRHVNIVEHLVTHFQVQPLIGICVANPTLSVSRELLKVARSRLVERLDVPFFVAPVQLRRSHVLG